MIVPTYPARQTTWTASPGMGPELNPPLARTWTGKFPTATASRFYLARRKIGRQVEPDAVSLLPPSKDRRTAPIALSRVAAVLHDMKISVPICGIALTAHPLKCLYGFTRVGD